MTAAKFCERCGVELAAGSRFCEACGSPVGGAAAAAASPAPGRVCPQCSQADQVVRAKEYGQDPESGPPGTRLTDGGDEPELKELERVELLEFIGKPERPEPFSVDLWVWVLFIPFVNVIAIWFAPIRLISKGVLAILVAGVVVGFLVSDYEAMGVPYIIGTVAMIYYCVALITTRSRREKEIQSHELPEWQQMTKRWESLCHCFRCKVVWLDGSAGSRPVPVQQAKSLLAGR